MQVHIHQPEGHEVHNVTRPQGHGYLDQKHHKGMRSPMSNAISGGSGTPAPDYSNNTPPPDYGDMNASS